MTLDSHFCFGISCEISKGLISLFSLAHHAEYDEVMPYLILVVEDDAAVREMVCDALQLAGYETSAASEGLEALSKQLIARADLIISDINMPKMNGFDLVKKLRVRGDDTPVVFLTARNEKPDVGQGFRLGADDYISKPFGIEELVLRVGAIIRRSAGNRSLTTYTIGPLTVDLDKVSVSLDGKAVNLSPTEFKLLVTLIENRSRVVSREFLLDKVWDFGFADSSTVVDTYISYLRKKLHTSEFQGIRTVRGFGFQIADS